MQGRINPGAALTPGERAGEALLPAGAALGQSAAQLVADVVRRRILEGALPPGTCLRQEELAAGLGVSRQPVREALQRLVMEGLLVKQPDRSVAVRRFTLDEVRENYTLRALLESAAARFAAAAITDRHLTSLRAVQEAMNRALVEGDAGLAVELNARIHRLVHEASRMPTLISLIEQLWIGLTVFTPLFVPGRGRHSREEHEAVIAALAARDPDRAEAAMRHHIESAARDYFRYAEATSQAAVPLRPAPGSDEGGEP
jgi:DNA-binding GntR family transcriptional regulator